MNKSAIFLLIALNVFQEENWWDLFSAGDKLFSCDRLWTSWDPVVFSLWYLSSWIGEFSWFIDKWSKITNISSFPCRQDDCASAPSPELQHSTDLIYVGRQWTVSEALWPPVTTLSIHYGNKDHNLHNLYSVHVVYVKKGHFPTIMLTTAAQTTLPPVGTL